MKNIAFYAPSFGSGGAERVMAILINYFQRKPDTRVYLIVSDQEEIFYKLDERVTVVRPSFDYKKYSRLTFTLKIFGYLRSEIKQIKPDAAICFGGKYNAFFLLACKGLNCKTFISDRSRPGISYGKVLNLLNRFLYPSAYGIVSQTRIAEKILLSQISHKHVTVIGNPVPLPELPSGSRKKVVLNVGRFIRSKNQDLLVRFFKAAMIPEFELVFLGDGKLLEDTRKLSVAEGIESQVHFHGNAKDVFNYYKSSAIFAFTSVSEGFPNALAEAMAAGCACISFDCMAGPADLIDDGINGFLIPVGDHKLYIEKLKLLMENTALANEFGRKAHEKMKQFESDKISELFWKFINT